MSDRIRINFVCLGNICRSPLAEGLFRHHVTRAGLGQHFTIASSGTSAYHVGEAPDPGSVRIARKHGLDISDQRSQQFTKRDLDRFDYIIPMDPSNRRNIISLLPNGDVEPLRGRIWLMRNFEHVDDGSGHDAGVPDPWGGGPDGFAEVYRIIDRASANLLTFLTRQHSQLR